LQGLVVRLWSDPQVKRLLRRAEAAYTARRQAMLRALAARGIAASGRTGMNVWVPVAEEITTVRLLLDAGWAVAGGERFRIHSPPAIRITIATLADGETEAVADALASILAPPRRTRSA
jgi:DNA-binding transcriptional MocR family regulator